MRRRKFVTLIGGAVAWPIGARGQQTSARVIGRLVGGATQAHLDAAFQKGLNSVRYFQGQNFEFEFRQTVDYRLLSEMAADLVRRHVSLIFAAGPAESALAAKAATATIPIVFACGEDPVESGLVDNLSRPGRNVTGVTFFGSPLEEKRIELLHELLPTENRLAILINPSYGNAELQIRNVQTAARQFGKLLVIFAASSDSDIEGAYEKMIQQRVGALLVATDPFLFARRGRIISIAADRRLPVIYNNRQYVEEGGLLSYGTNIAEMFRQSGIYAGKILAGSKPADLPVLLPTRYDLVINLTTAKALGLVVPPTLLARADEVIE